MIVKTVTLSRWGPFYEPVKISLDPRVTILTGANDMGKSSILNGIEILFSQGVATEDNVNQDHLYQGEGPWTKDPQLFIEAELEFNRSGDMLQHNNIAPGDNGRFRRRVAPDLAQNDSQSVLTHYGRGGYPINLPKIVKPKSIEPIRTEFDLNALNPIEGALLNAASEKDFNLQRILSLGDLAYTAAIDKINRKLNQLLRQVLPARGALEFELKPIAGKRERLALFLRDQFGGMTPFGIRGEGVRKIVTLIADLITTHRRGSHRLVIVDEPENSLHSDAQHLLREFLWEITSGGDIQVIYATHSPAMINPARPEQVRVVVRKKAGEFATSTLLENPSISNFTRVRSSLGMSIADSLLYAPVTIVSEGQTEVRCLPLLLDKLCASKVQGFEAWEKVSGLCHFLDGAGDNFELLVRFASSHGTRPILFLDGDKRRTVQQQKIDERHPDVPVILTDGDSEFEELVSTKTYLKALCGLCEVDYQEELVVDFNAWKNERVQPGQRRAFSKLIEEWFSERIAVRYPRKAEIMRNAINLSEVSEINFDCLSTLVNRVQDALRGTSFGSTS